MLHQMLAFVYGNSENVYSCIRATNSAMAVMNSRTLDGRLAVVAKRISNISSQQD